LISTLQYIRWLKRLRIALKREGATSVGPRLQDTLSSIPLKTILWARFVSQQLH